jgi:hypothetical protein
VAVLVAVPNRAVAPTLVGEPPRRVGHRSPNLRRTSP